MSEPWHPIYSIAGTVEVTMTGLMFVTFILVAASGAPAVSAERGALLQHLQRDAC